MSEPDRSVRISSANLWTLITGFMPARVVHVAAELGIADHLATEAKTAERLAQEIDTAPVPLRRLLRALASIGLIEERERGLFALTDAGSLLCSDAPGSLRSRPDVRWRARMAIVGRAASQREDGRIRHATRLRRRLF